MLNWRLVHKEDYYDTLVKWWGEHNFPIIAYESLPTRIFVITKEEEDLYAVPVFDTDSNWCIIGFPTSNKRANKKNREGALEVLLEKLTGFMALEGKKIIMTTSSNPKLMETFERVGFNKAEENVNYYTKNI